jgi:uncharacterized protein YjbI with pentapeptide repeats
MTPGPEHFARLTEGGVFAWNEWRRDHPDVHPEFRGLDLAGIDLSGVDLSGADLIEANLARANLYGANLVGSNFYGARLSETTLAEASLNSANLQCADLSGALLDQAEFHLAYLSGADLRKASLRNAFLANADLGESATKLPGANMEGADLSGANLRSANLTGANLKGANLTGADLFWANLSRTDLREASLVRASLQLAILVGTNLEGADLTGCRVYGMSAWDLRLDRATQDNLIITPAGEATITADNLEVAQFLYLLLNNRGIRNVLDTITSKVVLILGRFTEPRKAVLDSLRRELRQRDYLPVLFDFDQPASRDITETVSTIAHMSRFVIADITDARSIPQELMAIVPNLPSVPVQPLLLASQEEYAMFAFFRRFPWVLEPYLYADQDSLLASLEEKVIAPAEAKAREQLPPARAPRQPGS